MLTFDQKSNTLHCDGDWDLANLPLLEKQLDQIHWPTQGEITIDCAGIKKMDTAGAWLIDSWIKQLSTQHLTAHLKDLAKTQASLLSTVKKKQPDAKEIPTPTTYSWLAKVGKNSIEQCIEFRNYLAFIGKLSYESLRILRHPTHIRWNSLAAVIDTTGYRALPIIALLSFMIGIVLTYQMGLQLKTYGANIFIVDLLGLSILREFAPLITAIMVAGRTGSAFTAQLGIMKINQEIDALDTMGVSSSELLILPRIMGLIISLPLLTIWANIFGILGGMTMASNMLGVGFYDFLHRFQQAIPLRMLIIGLAKAPVFAFIIASVGCFEGMQVQGNAESIGKNTTRSVVLGIFFIILADAAFSILLSKFKL